MDFHILGRLEVLDEGRGSVAVAGSKQRALLALLLLHGNETLSTTRLIDELWGEQPPATAAKTVQVYVSRLRKSLAAGGDGNGSAGPVLTREHGYELRLDPERLDAARFERLLAEGRREVAAGRPERAASTLEDALALWRGPPLADLAYERFAQPEIARLDELKGVALELLIEAKLALGRHAEVVAELETLTREHPYRERLRALLMLALYRSDRQAEALQAYQDARRQLVAELGIEPGEQLRALERAILAQDPALSLPVAAPVELPEELATGTPIVGREGDLEWLREQWRAAREAPGRLAAIVGARGIGKTRLAAELAAEVRREGASVLYLDGAGQPLAVPAVLDAARRAALVVLDDVDRAGEDVRAAVGELVTGVPERPLLLLATAEDEVPTARLGVTATRSLTPLGAAGVRAVAQLYAGPRADGDVPVELLLEASGGVPLRAHRVAAEWARAEAAGRLDAAAGRAASERTGLRVAEDELAGNVVELQAVSRRTASDAASGVVACPFKGLAAFDIEDARVFFGREQLVAEMVARLAGAPLMGVVGPSGSGKSSALRAGLLAALSAGVLPGSERWPLALLRPGEHPMAALDRATADAPPEGRMIVAVDQFEETFTACRDESERAAFVDALVAAARDPRRRALVLLAVRADFYGRCAAYPELARLLGACHVLVGAMRRAELRRAIELPAQVAGLRVEHELADALIADVEGEPGGLPLLSTALLELWQHRDGRVLRMSAYEHAGGVRGAVARLAERAYARLDPPRRELARRILLRLAEGDGDAVVRRRVPLTELEADRDERVAEVLSVLAGERLVTVGAGEAEVAHEALLREWPRLRGWLEQDAEARRLQRHITLAAREWGAAGRDPGELYRGARLASALDLAAEHGDALNRLEREFLDEARLVSERESVRARRLNRRLRMLLAGALLALVVAGAAGLIALDQRGDARRTATVAEAERLGAQALTVDELDRALLLARTGVALEDSVATRGNLLAALLRVPRGSLGVLPDVRDNAIYGIALSPRGDRIAIGDHVGEVRLFDARTRRELASYRLQSGLVQRLAFSPDGATLAVAGQEPENEPPGALIDLLDARTLERRQRIVLPPPPEGGIAGASPVFTADGLGLTVLQIPFSDQPQTVFRIDLDRGAVVGSPFRFRGSASDPAYSSDRRRLFVTSEPEDVTYELDTTDLHVIARHPAGGTAVALYPDEDLLAVGAADGSMRFVDLPSGRVHRLAGKHAAEVSAMEFSADGRTLVSGDSHGGLIAWDVEHRVLRERLEGHAAEVSSLVTTPDGRTAITAGSIDGKVAFWDLDGSRRLVHGVPLASRFVADESTPRGVAVSPDDRTLAVTQNDGTVQLLDTSTLEPRAVLEAFDDPALATDFSPDGRLLAVAADKGGLGLWDARTLTSVRRLKGLRGWIQAVAFSPDGRLVAAGDNSGNNRRLLIWDVGSGRQTRLESDFPPSQLTFSPDGRLLAGAGRERGVEVRDVASGRLVGKPQLDEMARSVTFSPDGKLLFVGLYNGTGTFLSTEDWKPAGPGIRGHGQRILNARFTPDGQTLATSSADGTVQLWDVASRRLIGAPLVVQRNDFVASILSRDGSYLYALPTGTEGMRLALAPHLWRDLACAIAGRELTRREWDEVLPDRQYREVCAPA
jgi:WD40 repeat protein/DNA-binding SARP family transcriptional activator